MNRSGLTGTAPASLTPSDVAQARLIAQRLIRPGEPTVIEAVRWLTALQAQDFDSGVLSAALRTQSRRRSEVIAALDAGTIVRSWPMRGTLHLTAAEDLPWMLSLLAPRAVRTSAARRPALGLDESQLEEARAVAIGALSGGRRLHRGDLLEAWASAGFDCGGGRGNHALRFLAMTGTLVLGPTDPAGDHLVVLLDEWVPQPRKLDREEALGELATRYFRSHGPATAADLAAWSGLTAADLRTAVGLARPFLDTATVDSTEHLLDPQTFDLLAAARAEAAGVVLLPGFDEFLLGYRDRSAQLDPAFADRIVPGGNGIFRPTVVSAGQVVGTWTRTGRPPRHRITATAFTSFTPDVDDAVRTLSADLP